MSKSTEPFRRPRGSSSPAGNTTTLAHYLELLGGAGLLTGLSKFARRAARQKGSSPKLQVLNTALMTAQSGFSFEEAKEDREFWGRLVESAVGAHLANAAAAVNASSSTGARATEKWISSHVPDARLPRSR